jgi:hypothetical protein
MAPLPESHWFTAARLQRLIQALPTLPSSQQEIAIDETKRKLWRVCGSTHEELDALLAILAALGIASHSETLLRRTPTGDRLAKALKGNDLTALGLVLIRSGCFHDQGRSLIEHGSTDGIGNLSCPLHLARSGSPQLLGVLGWWRDVRLLPSVFVPKQLVTEIAAIWALLPPSPETPEWVKDRKAVGNRAELYTVQAERSRVADPSTILWVARDADDLGWDVEDRSGTTTRHIEVKGRRDRDVVFFLSETQLARANALRTSYEIHFWGEIDLQREPAVEYAALRAAGYPLVIIDLPAALAAGKWVAEPIGWRVRQASL